jgi:hypothetical protein
LSDVKKVTAKTTELLLIFLFIIPCLIGGVKNENIINHKNKNKYIAAGGIICGSLINHYLRRRENRKASAEVRTIALAVGAP